MKYKLCEPKKMGIRGWFVGVRGDDFLYLHSDAVVRDGTIHRGKWSGYFPTKESANEAIALYAEQQKTEQS